MVSDWRMPSVESCTYLCCGDNPLGELDGDTDRSWKSGRDVFEDVETDFGALDDVGARGRSRHSDGIGAAGEG